MIITTLGNGMWIIQEEKKLHYAYISLSITINNIMTNSTLLSSDKQQMFKSCINLNSEGLMLYI